VRHSKIDLTMNVYTHTALGDLATAVESLPSIRTEGPRDVVLAATKTT